MKIEIWSDVMCPFCYIGKRRFENALNLLPFKDEIEVEWKSFQLDPSIESEPGRNIHQYLAERKGFSVEKAKELNDHVTAMAAAEGLQYNFDKAVVANSFDAHRFAQVAKKNGKGIEAEESLFRAYFTEGKDISNHDTLAQLGSEIGLDGAAVKEALESDAYTKEVQKDISEAEALAIRGVPFFVIDRKYAVSGAQASETFVQALNQSYTEWKKQNTQLKTIDGQVCTPGGDCK
ncbi:DsbA family oxidoreductase [Niastella populi]|uniref:Disulfide bond formation protein DsbA n=1 Tax=Niastella populi TaxID=550983 RepID=A0A1V9F5S7_9BACT|nr:DsbA family oxidoreductase [Niastella populi]OQP53627.1 disulfide bond formation protein DsbA [Niastella populi]